MKLSDYLGNDSFLNKRYRTIYDLCSSLCGYNIEAKEEDGYLVGLGKPGEEARVFIANDFTIRFAILPDQLSFRHATDREIFTLIKANNAEFEAEMQRMKIKEQEELEAKRKQDAEEQRRKGEELLKGLLQLIPITLSVTSNTSPSVAHDEAISKDTYIGSCCKYYTIKQLKYRFESNILNDLKSSWHNVSSHSLEDDSIKAWLDSIKTIKENLSFLPPSYDDVYAIFEYVIPRYNPISFKGVECNEGVRAEVVLVAGKKTVILEFKQAIYYQQKHLKQVLFYKDRLEKFHNQFKGGNFTCKTILVLTAAKDVYLHDSGVIICSRDRLHDAMIETLCKTIRPCQDIEAWLDGFDTL